jgi:putative membrane protein
VQSGCGSSKLYVSHVERTASALSKFARSCLIPDHVGIIGLIVVECGPSVLVVDQQMERPKMNRGSAAIRVGSLGLTCGLLLSAVGTVGARAQAAGPPEASASLNAVDFNFVGQANLGAPFQIDSGRLAETKGTSVPIRSYAHLMVTSHIPVVDALNAILKQKNVTPSNTLLHGAYDAMISSLKADRGAAFDRDYVNGQVEYQKGNAALFEQEIQNGTDPDLKEFARQTLPKIVDHLQRAEKLAAAGGRVASK